ncbi:hypothetical protein ACHRV1_18470 [Flavobacterium aquidurense]|uniref:hypothetical protein n=1 Tax=Flavobacterium aquidurense TaxID=362413 RepID=UPI003757C2CD
MENKSTLIVLLLFLLFGCRNVDYQKIIINNKNKTISLLDSSFVIDSISVRKFGKAKLSISLKDKLLGSSFLDIRNPDSGYKTYVNELNNLSCEDKNLGLSIIIRKKGESLKITEDMANNFERNRFVQVLYIKYFPCSNEIDTLQTDGHLK